MDYFKYFRYKTANCNQYKYVRAHLREEALTMLSYLINDDGNGDPSETYLFLKNFEEIELSEVPDNADVLYESHKNRICVSGTSEGPVFLHGTDKGWTRNSAPIPLNIYYALPYKVFIVANSKEAAISKILPLEKTIKRIENKYDEILKQTKDGRTHSVSKIDGTSVEIHLLMESVYSNDYGSLLPEGCKIITEATLEYDRWSNYITGYLFRREGHQNKITLDQYIDSLHEGLLSLYDLIKDFVPTPKELLNYQMKNRILFSNLLYCSPSSLGRLNVPITLKCYKDIKQSSILFLEKNEHIYALISRTGEIIELEKDVADAIKKGGTGNLEDYDIYYKIKSWRIVPVIMFHKDVIV